MILLSVFSEGGHSWCRSKKCGLVERTVKRHHVLCTVLLPGASCALENRESESEGSRRWQRVYCTLLLPFCVWLSCNSTDCSQPGSSLHGISQARILECIVISSSRGSSWPRDQTHLSSIGRQILYHWASWKVHTVPDVCVYIYVHTPIHMKDVFSYMYICTQI